MIPIESDPHKFRGDTELPFHACCADCGNMSIQLDGSFWCTEYDDEVDGEHVCER
jgi:hypothetical protein